MSVEVKAKIVLVAQAVLMLFVVSAPYIENGGYDLSLVPLTANKVVGILLNIIGFVILLASLLAMKSSFEIRAKQRQSSALITAWPFSWVRNPIYLAAILMSFGWSISFLSMLGALGSVVLSLVLLKKIELEEVFLKDQFGLEYDNYRKSVAKIVPKSFR